MIEIRKANLHDAQGIAKVHVDSWRSTYRDLVPQDFLDKLDANKRADFWAKLIHHPALGDHVIVAETKGQVVGFSSGGRNRTEGSGYQGEIYAIYLASQFQGMGMGRKLFNRSVELLQSEGQTSLMVWVLEGNPACGFYAAMGGLMVSEKWDQIGGKDLKELAYGWKEFHPS